MDQCFSLVEIFFLDNDEWWERRIVPGISRTEVTEAKLVRSEVWRWIGSLEESAVQRRL